MRIAQVCRVGAPHVGGMERVVAGLSRALLARGHEVKAFTLDRAVSTGEPLPAGVFEGVRYHRLRRVGPRRYPFAWGLTEAVAGFDLVHVHGLDGLADGLVRSRPAPVGISTHGGYFHTPRNLLIKQIALRTVTRATLRRADAVWFTSVADERLLARAGVRGQVLENGVDIERFKGVARDPEPGRWLVYGRVDVHKGLDLVIDVLPRLPGVTVDVVGPEARPGLVDTLREQARARGVGDRMLFRGALPDEKVREVVRRAELALFPSRHEGFGLAVVELMAAGVVPVLAPIPAFLRLVRPGVDGHFVAFDDPVAAAPALERLRGADHADMAASARERAGEWSWDRRVIAFEVAYQEVLRCGSA